MELPEEHNNLETMNGYSQRLLNFRARFPCLKKGIRWRTDFTQVFTLSVRSPETSSTIFFGRIHQRFGRVVDPMPNRERCSQRPRHVRVALRPQYADGLLEFAAVGARLKGDAPRPRDAPRVLAQHIDVVRLRVNLQKRDVRDAHQLSGHVCARHPDLPCRLVDERPHARGRQRPAELLRAARAQRRCRPERAAVRQDEVLPAER